MMQMPIGLAIYMFLCFLALAALAPGEISWLQVVAAPFGGLALGLALMGFEWIAHKAGF